MLPTRLRPMDVPAGSGGLWPSLLERWLARCPAKATLNPYDFFMLGRVDPSRKAMRFRPMLRRK